MALTEHFGIPMPVEGDDVAEEFFRLQTAWGVVDTALKLIFDNANGRAPASHTHAMAGVVGLVDALANKMAADATFKLDDLTDVDGATDAPTGYVLVKNGDGVFAPSTALAALGPHGHLMSEITGLATALAAKADAAATATALAAKADAAAVATALAAKADAAATATALSNVGMNAFIKSDASSVVFTKTGANALSLKAGTIVGIDGDIHKFDAATAVVMPALSAGVDYAIWVKPDWTIEATSNHTAPPVAGSRKLGGFHYAPGGNAAGYNAGGDTNPAINEYSLWDLKFRPACADPRGMALVAGRFWVDIYLLGVNHHTDGTSKYNVTIADGSSPPKVPAAFGGNGSTTYANLTWFVAAEVMESHGKELLSYSEFAAAMYGTKEAQSGGTDPVSTILRNAYTSKWGVMLATGNLWIWGRDFGGSYGAASYVDQGRGSAYMLSNAALLGGNWGDAAYSGSRASYWNYLPSNSYAHIGARGRCDHLVLA
ncbi:hypothetical protein [Shinella sp. NM-101]|uniref:phage major tropism determinant n=1 Tax=Shinella sp. NM-101 TaxID=2744455 RepID=UPI001F272768|nr:hypothetical protein [Shinella sp. NM-101]